MSAERIRSFEEFWPYYVRAHSKRGNRTLHFAGTTAAMACVAGALLLRKPKLAALAPLVGYGAAWIGHFVIEGNVPATFGHPLWSLKADFVMWSKIVDGTMDAEVARYTAPVEQSIPAASDDVDASPAARRVDAPTDRYAVN